MSVGHGDGIRPARHSTGSYDRYPQSSLTVPVENGLPPDGYGTGALRDSVSSGQPSPTVRLVPKTEVTAD